jgi:lysophospholipase L1-like esterase
MSVSIRARLLGCTAAAVAVLGGLVFAPASGAALPNLGSTYLALGDSLAYGYHAAQFKAEYPDVNPANFESGYVQDFAKILKLANPRLQVINDGCPGETTETFIHGSGIPPAYGKYCAGGTGGGSPFPYAFLHHSYGSHVSQLEDALAILKENPNVSPITLDIGANDLLQYLEYKCGFPAGFTCSETQVETLIANTAKNAGLILGELRAADPKAEIIMVGIYDPYPLSLPAPGADKVLAGFDGALESAAKATGASFADPEPEFNPSYILGLPEKDDLTTICAFTAMCPGGTYNPTSALADIHPTTLGYEVMAGVVAFDYLTN